MTDEHLSRPITTTYEVSSLVKMVNDGLIRVPTFQRVFRWDREDVRRLFDSILKGYPIGNLLLWIRSAPEEELRLETLHIKAAATNRAYYVVDGQQRITSLANVVAESGRDDPKFTLSYDLKARKFLSTPKNPGPESIPVPVLFDTRRLIQWFHEFPDIDEHLDHATEVNAILRQYVIPVNQVEAENDEVLRDIFDRMNNYGKSLKRSEIFSALNASTDQNRGNSLTFPDISANINRERSFGFIDEDTILKVVLARRGVDVFRDIHNEFDRPDDEGPEAAYLAGQQSLLRAVRFLQEDAGVPHISFLAHRYPLIVLARFFAFHPDTEHRSLRLLRRWFWRTLVVGPGHFKGGATGALRALCRKVDEEHASGSIQALLDTLESAKSPPLDLGTFRANSATTKTLLCAWWSVPPRNPDSGDAYEQDDLAVPLGEKLSAADVVYTLFPPKGLPADLRSHFANRMLMPDSTDDYVASRLPWAHSDAGFSAAVFQSHLLPPNATELAMEAKFEEILIRRAEIIEEQIRQFTSRMCEWGSDDSPSLSDLILDDDDDPR